MFDKHTWMAVPFHFWSAAFFLFGSIVGSFLNVCIHRLPRGESIVSPPSHCPQCGYSIPWFLNIPLVTWVYLRARCRNCSAPISPRYFLVELLTATGFLACWLGFGHRSVGLALVYCLLLAGFIAATFIDIEHFIIPDQITLGGVAAGLACSLLVPALHQTRLPAISLQRCFIGILVGAGVIYAILRLGKVLYGRHHVQLGLPVRIVFTETSVVLPDREIPYEELFYRRSDTIHLHATQVELIDRCYANVPVRLSASALHIGTDEFRPEDVPHLEVQTDQITLPREAMGLGDVKFMAGIGAFVGAEGVVFSLMISALVGALVGLSLIGLGKREWSSKLPYGPYIALAATLWIFAGQPILRWWARLVGGP